MLEQTLQLTVLRHQVPLDLTERLRGATALADIRYEGQCRSDSAFLDKTETDLQREFGAVFLAAANFDHRPFMRMRKAGSLMLRISCPVAFRQDDGQWLADQFVAAVTEHLFGAGVHEGDAPRLVDGHHTRRCRIEPSTESAFVGVGDPAECLRGLLALGGEAGLCLCSGSPDLGAM